MFLVYSHKRVYETTTAAAMGASKLWFGDYVHAFVQENPKATSIERTNFKILLLAFSENVVKWLKKTNKKRKFYY